LFLLCIIHHDADRLAAFDPGQQCAQSFGIGRGIRNLAGVCRCNSQSDIILAADAAAEKGDSGEVCRA